jgi:hypothetical protein
MTPIEILTYVATQTGAGITASYVFAWLRRVVTFPNQRPESSSARQFWRWTYRLLHSDDYMIWTAPLLALVIGSLASVALAIATGVDAWSPAWAFISAWANQQWYRHGKMERLELDWTHGVSDGEQGRGLES